MYVYVVRTCIRCGTNVYLGGTKMGGTKRRWYEKTGIQAHGACVSRKSLQKCKRPWEVKG